MVKVTAAQFAAKYKEKREVWRFLTGEVRAYLPAYDNVTVWHLRDLASGKRTVIKSENIKHINVPQFEHLAIKDMMEYWPPSPR